MFAAQNGGWAGSNVQRQYGDVLRRGPIFLSVSLGGDTAQPYQPKVPAVAGRPRAF